MIRIERYPSGHIKSIGAGTFFPLGPTWETTAVVYTVILLWAEAIFH